MDVYSSNALKSTPEQCAAIDLAKQQQSFKIMAYAGTGKTTTLQLISQAMPQRRGLYLAFNKVIATEAREKFPATVECRTFHSMAYRHVDRRITDKLRLPRYTPQSLANAYHLQPIQVRRAMQGRFEFMHLTPARQANVINNALENFCSTHASYPAPRHIDLPDWLHPDDAEAVRQTLFPFVEKRWLEATHPQHHAGINHDIYLKLWALAKPTIQADYILFDEAQDADPLMLGILMAQQQSQVIYVGDAHQQIYEWRGAVNAMKRLPLPDTRLTQSFRFGSNIAEIANLFLTELGETVPLEGNPEHSSQVSYTPIVQKKDAILCRTNAKAMGLLMAGIAQGHKVGLQADTERLRRFIDGAEALRMGRRVFDIPELSWFTTWREVQELCESTERTDMKPLVRLIDEHNTAPLKQALSHLVDIKQADYVISTAHKAKGLEWDNVQIEDDFQFQIIKGVPQVQPQELHLLYVAATRARKRLDIYALSPLIKSLQQRQSKAKSNPVYDKISSK